MSKLFIWNEDGVLQDYTHGMIAAIGADLQEALIAIRESCPHGMESFPNDKPTEII